MESYCVHWSFCHKWRWWGSSPLAIMRKYLKYHFMGGKNTKDLTIFARICHIFLLICKPTGPINLFIRTRLETAPQAGFKRVRPIFVCNLLVLRKRGH